MWVLCARNACRHARQLRACQEIFFLKLVLIAVGCNFENTIATQLIQVSTSAMRTKSNASQQIRIREMNTTRL